MSYSFGIKAPNKAAAKSAIAAKFDEMAATQPVHKRDRAAALANANTVIDLLADDDTKDVAVSCNGYLTWNGSGEFTPATAPIGSASVGCMANHAIRE